ncbi:hypothetical protein T484DRAFT_1929005 [Baffinella frigidus]|nr:hypothetical protein T484DRAFT_1929005 [Cryptophyta sp. CCMP2293]|mmetsp:Transcript_626/g.1459  ORF Transcript_626/g.1459 Transcript_626/m.1459 type:complete len:399 (+) Transcript_626:33-1229(+)
MVQSEMEEGQAAHQREESQQPQQPAWRRMQVAALAVLATGLLVAAGVVSKGNSASPTELGLHVVHLPNGKIEMEYTRQARKARFGSSDYAPESQAFREGYAFARQAAPQNNLGPAQQRARFERVQPGPQPEPQGAFALRAPAGSVAVVGTPSDLSAMQGTLDNIGSAQQSSLIQQEQQEQAIQAAEANILAAPAPFRAARQRAALSDDPALVQNALMREAASAMYTQEAPVVASQLKPKAEEARLRGVEVARAQLRQNAKQAREQSLTEVPAPQAAETAAQVSEEAGEEAQQAREAAPAAEAPAAEAPAGEEQAPEGFSVAAPACGGNTGVGCAVPTSNTGLQALQARLSSDETAIFTLTQDVQDLRKQNEALEAAEPGPPAPLEEQAEQVNQAAPAA